jgi:hypothetical protein
VTYSWNRFTNGQRDALVKVPIRTATSERERALSYHDREGADVLRGVEAGLAALKEGKLAPNFGLLVAIARYEHAGWMPDKSDGGTITGWRRWRGERQEKMSSADLVPWLDEVEKDVDKWLKNEKIDGSFTPPPELLVLSGRGIRFGVPGHYGLFEETPTLEAAIGKAREHLATGHANACVAIRIEAKLIDGIGDGTDREFARFEVYPDRVVLVPKGQGGLTKDQETKARALRKDGLL